MSRSVFKLPRMDCGAEEQLVRMALADQADVVHVAIDLSLREVAIVHAGPLEPISSRLGSLKLGAELISSELGETAWPLPGLKAGVTSEARTLKIVLGINAGMFAAEAVAAVLADSSALLADSLDMFADAAVYGLALYGVHRSQSGQLKAARMSGWLQLLLAIGALLEVVRRAAFGSEPESLLMGGVAAVALVANVTCMWLLARHRHGGAHMRASWIFTTNDVIANAGVIAAAVITHATASNLPDLVIAAVIGGVVLRGAMRILRLKS